MPSRFRYTNLLPFENEKWGTNLTLDNSNLENALLDVISIVQNYLFQYSLPWTILKTSLMFLMQGSNNFEDLSEYHIKLRSISKKIPFVLYNSWHLKLFRQEQCNPQTTTNSKSYRYYTSISKENKHICITNIYSVNFAYIVQVVVLSNNITSRTQISRHKYN